ncbi:cysteine hydrolase family protein [Flexivirga sp. B27]
MHSSVADLADATVVLIDYQQTYTSGPLQLDGWEPALDAAADLLVHARSAGATVIHVVNDSGPGSPFDLQGENGRIHPKVASVAGEAVVTKRVPNAFIGTDLSQRLRAAGRKHLVIAGFMTHMCVTFTSEGAFLEGYQPTIVADACATRALRSVAGAVSAAQLHEAALATIGDLYGAVVSTVGDLR